MSDHQFAALLAAVLGLVVGSFLNVVIHRVPARQSVVKPPSACPNCKNPVRFYDNIPVLSWLLLRGKCRDCSEPISLRYPVIELVTAVAFAAVGGFFGLQVVTLAYLYGAAIAIGLTVIDIETHRLPDVIVLPSYLVVGILLTLGSWQGGDWSSLLRALFGGVILFVAYLIMVIAYPQGMGLGDVKLAGVLGALLGWMGWGALLIGGFAAFFLGGAFSVALIALRRANRKTGIPFGPWMLAGTALGVAIGEPLWSAYLGAFA